MDYPKAEKAVADFIGLLDEHKRLTDQHTGSAQDRANRSKKKSGCGCPPSDQSAVKSSRLSMLGRKQRTCGGGLGCAAEHVMLVGALRDTDARARTSAQRVRCSPPHSFIPRSGMLRERCTRNGHYRAAVQAAGAAIELQLRTKLERFDVSGDALVTQAFTLEPPQEGKPRLRFLVIDEMDEGVLEGRRRGRHELRQGVHDGNQKSRVARSARG